MLGKMIPGEMDEHFGITYLNHLELTALQLEDDVSREGRKKRQETGELIGRVKNTLIERLRQQRRENRHQLRKSLAQEGRDLDKLLKVHPSMDLCKPEDFVLYWYVHGEFPGDMCLDEMEKTQRAVQHWLHQLICREEPDKAYAAYCRSKMEVQLQQLQDRIEAFSQEAFGDDGSSCQRTEEKPGNSIDWLDEDTDDLIDWTDDEGDDELASEDPEDGPVYLAFLPEEPEHPEDMTIPELGSEIEKQEFNLLCLKSAENGKEGTEKPFLWQQSLDSVKALLSRLREFLRQRLLEALGVEAEDPSVPEGFEDGDLPISLGGDDLERPEDIVASWYLSESFPIITSGEKLLRVEGELNRQKAKLELNEPPLEDEAEHALWEFRWEQRAVQLDEIQDMQWDLVTDWGEEWDPEEDSDDE